MNKPEEALSNYQQALVIERRIGFKRGVAASLNEMAQVYSLLGKPDATLASLNEAIQVRKEIGAIAKPSKIMIVAELPKTRSGKIMRRLLRDVAEHRDIGDVTTLADSTVMDLISAGSAAGSED